MLLPHPLNDPTAFGSLQDLFCISRKEGCVRCSGRARPEPCTTRAQPEPFPAHLLVASPCRYLGGLRLLQATCKKFYQFCSNQG